MGAESVSALRRALFQPVRKVLLSAGIPALDGNLARVLPGWNRGHRQRSFSQGTPEDLPGFLFRVELLSLLYLRSQEWTVFNPGGARGRPGDLSGKKCKTIRGRPCAFDASLQADSPAARGSHAASHTALEDACGLLDWVRGARSGDDMVRRPGHLVDLPAFAQLL